MVEEIIKLLEKYKVIKENGCWETSIGGITEQGYVRIKFENKKHRIHRISCAYFHKLDLNNEEQLALHKCNNKACWNPEHLYVGTGSQNYQDWQNSGHYRNAKREQTHCKKGHVLDGKNSLGYRFCITCSREGALKRYHAKKHNRTKR